MIQSIESVSMLINKGTIGTVYVYRYVSSISAIISINSVFYCLNNAIHLVPTMIIPMSSMQSSIGKEKVGFVHCEFT